MDEKERIQKEIEESPHFPRDKSKYMLSPNKTKQPGFPLPSQQSAVPATEPNVDFEFHVKIFINSGKCVLHTLKEEEKRKMKKDRSFSGTALSVSALLCNECRTTCTRNRNKKVRHIQFHILGEMKIAPLT